MIMTGKQKEEFVNTFNEHFNRSSLQILQEPSLKTASGMVYVFVLFCVFLVVLWAIILSTERTKAVRAHLQSKVGLQYNSRRQLPNFALNCCYQCEVERPYSWWTKSSDNEQRHTHAKDLNIQMSNYILKRVVWMFWTLYLNLFYHTDLVTPVRTIRSCMQANVVTKGTHMIYCYVCIVQTTNYK